MPRPQAPPALDVFNLAPDHRPRRVLSPTTVSEVVEEVRTAAAAGEPVRVVGTGHGLAPIEDAVALSTAALTGVDIDPLTATARVAAGSRWGDVLAAAARHRLAPVTGSSPTVGVVGLLLGGGLGPVGRTLGWASDHVRSFELVTAAGDVVVASATSHRDLFWALRGGKQAPGVVTAVELDLLPLTRIYAGGLYFAADDAEQVAVGFAAWAQDLPESLTASLALMRLPAVDDVPAPLRGREVVHVRVAVAGVEPHALADAGVALVAPLRALADPILDTVAVMPYAELGAVHADPAGPMPVLDGGALLSRFDADAARALVRTAGPGTGAPFAAVEVRCLGGALARRPDDDCVAGRDAGALLSVVSLPDPALFASVVPAATAQVVGALAPWASGGMQPNFIGALNQPSAWDRVWPDAVRQRLTGVLDEFDPARLFAR